MLSSARGFAFTVLTLFAVSSGRSQAPPTSPPRSPAPNVGQRGGASIRNAGGRPVHNEAERAARFKLVSVPYSKAGLSAANQQMIAKLAHACQLLNELYLRQSDLGGYEMYHTTQNPDLLRLFAIHGSRWDVSERHEPFIGEEPLALGHELYPFGLTVPEIDNYVKLHPDQREIIHSPWTVVRSAPLELNANLSQPVVYKTPDQLYTYSYHVAYSTLLNPIADDLRAAARLSPDPAFANFLKLRADALLADTYPASDSAWLKLNNPKVDLIFAPRQNSLDGLLGVKTSYGAAILIRDDAESKKLLLYQEHEAAMRQALSVAVGARPSTDNRTVRMEVVDSPLRAGDLRYGYQAIVSSLSNDPQMQDGKTSKVFFKNFIDARRDNIILPVAKKMLTAAQAKEVTERAYLTGVILHEISTELSPSFAQPSRDKVPVSESMGPAHSDLEEAKTDLVGLFLAKWLVAQKLIPADELDEIYASAIAAQFQALRKGSGEAHPGAKLMELNYLLEQHVLSQNADMLYAIDYTALPAAVDKLVAVLLGFEAKGDRPGAEAWLTRYGAMPEALSSALERTGEIPVDVVPDFELASGVRP